MVSVFLLTPCLAIKILLFSKFCDFVPLKTKKNKISFIYFSSSNSRDKCSNSANAITYFLSIHRIAMHHVWVKCNLTVIILLFGDARKNVDDRISSRRYKKKKKNNINFVTNVEITTDHIALI